MLHYFEALLAYRLTKTASAERTISTMIRLCFISIFIGTAALTLVTAIMNGLEQATHQSIKGIHADLMIRSTTPLDYTKIKKVIAQEFPEVIASSPSSVYHALLDVDTDTPDIASVIFITALDPSSASKVTTLPSTVTSPQGLSFDALFTNDRVLIGKHLAQQFDLKVGSTFALLYPTLNSKRRKQLSLERTVVTVGGIFATGIDEFDANGIFVTHNFMHELTGNDTVNQITLKLAPRVDARMVQKKLQERLSLDVIAWQDLYPPLMAALKLEKYGMMLILILVIIIASVNTMALIFMFITHKRRTLGLLIAYGMAQQALTRTCLLIGAGVTGIAAASGIATGALASYLIDHFRLISLPDVYYVSYLPADLEAIHLLLIFVLVITIGLITSWYPTRQFDKKKITYVLKFDS